MIYFMFNGIFAFIFGIMAWRIVPRGWLLLKGGMGLIRTVDDDARKKVESRRVLSEGGNFVIGGILWLLVGIVFAILAAAFSIAAVVSIITG